MRTKSSRAAYLPRHLRSPDRQFALSFTLIGLLSCGAAFAAAGEEGNVDTGGTSRKDPAHPGRPFYVCEPDEERERAGTAQGNRTNGMAAMRSAESNTHVRKISPDPDAYADLPGLRTSKASRKREVVLRHRYGTNQAWNADGTAIYLSRGSLLLQGTDFDDMSYIPELAGRVAQFMPDDPRLMIVASRNGESLELFDPFRPAVARSFSLEGFSALSINTRSGVSADGSTLAVKGMAGSEQRCLLVDLENERVITSVSLEGTGFTNEKNKERRCLSSASGRYLVVDGQRPDRKYGNAVVYDAEGTRIRSMPENAGVECPGGHGDLGISGKNEDVFVGICKKGRGSLSRQFGGRTVSWNLSTGEYRDLGKGASHVSCRNSALRGWCIGSSYGKRGASIVAIDIEVGRTVELGSSFVEERRNYLDEPHAVPAPSGTKILFASNVDASADEAAGAFVMEIGSCD